jgi:hypothetical protein
MAKAAKKRSAKAGSAKAKQTKGAKTAAKRKGARKAAPARTGRKTSKTGGAARARKAAKARTSAKARTGGSRTRARKTSTAKRARTSPPQTSTARKKSASRSAASRRTARPSATAQPSTLGSAATMIRGAVAGAVAAVSQVLPWTSDQLDALQMLEQDHRRFETLLAQGEETTERAVKGRTQLLDTLTRELNAHEMKEEKFLYPMLEAYPEAKTIVLEGYQEHHVADVIVKELHQVAADDEQWGAKFKVLKENIEHHIQEEEGEMFRIARAVVPREELVALGERMSKAAAGG